MNRFSGSLGANSWARAFPVQLAAAILAGLVVFGLAYLVLGAMVAQVAGQPDGTPLSSVRGAPGSLAARISPGKVAIAAPPQGAEALLQQVEPGDRIDVIAVYPSTASQPVVSAVVVRGAVVLSPPPDTSGSPAVLEVSPDEAMVLTHVIQSGRHVVYAVWPAGGNPPEVPAVDLAALESRLSPR